MADIFTKKNARSLLNNRVIWFFGDSNVRAVYKDVVWLLQRNSIAPSPVFKKKMEPHFMNDVLTKGDSLHRGRSYEEERSYKDASSTTRVEFMFLTKCLTEPLRQKFLTLKQGAKSPDLIVINSCLWDICRWGPDGVVDYKKNIVELLKLMKECVHQDTLVIWTTTPPLAATIHGSLVIKQIQFMKHSARFEVMEGNLFVRQAVISHGFDVLDLHFHLLLQIHRRCPDGIHWEPPTVRHMTNLILTHVALAWGRPLPGNFRSPAIGRLLTDNETQRGPDSKQVNELQRLNAIANGGSTTPKTPKGRGSRGRNRGRFKRERHYRRPYGENGWGNSYNRQFEYQPY